MTLDDVMLELRELRGDVIELKEELHRYKGFVGGVAWCMSALTAVVGFVWGVVSGN